MGQVNNKGQPEAILTAYSLAVASVSTTGYELPVLPRKGQGRNLLGTRHCIYGLMLATSARPSSR